MKTSIFTRALSSFSRQLPVSASVDVAKVLEHQPEPGAQLAVPRARTAEVLATRDHGRGDLLRAQGGPVAVPGCEEVRHPVPDVRALCQSGPQHAWPQRRWRSRYVNSFLI